MGQLHKTLMHARLRHIQCSGLKHHVIDVQCSFIEQISAHKKAAFHERQLFKHHGGLSVTKRVALNCHAIKQGVGTGKYLTIGQGKTSGKSGAGLCRI